MLKEPNLLIRAHVLCKCGLEEEETEPIVNLRKTRQHKSAFPRKLSRLLAALQMICPLAQHSTSAQLNNTSRSHVTLSPGNNGEHVVDVCVCVRDDSC